MTAYRKCLWLATIFATSATALAQNADEPGASASAASRGEPPTPGEWRAYPRERHILGRLSGGIGIRLADSYGAGALAPPFAHVQGGFTFLNIGRMRMGPSIGLQLGFDSHSRTQATVQAGWLAYWRLSTRFGLLARVEVPALITGSWRPEFDTCIAVLGMPGAPVGQRTVSTLPGCTGGAGTVYARLPDGKSTAISFGTEAGVTAAVFVTGGIAVTAEVSGGVYFGDSFVSAPLLGLTLGALVDYELLP